VGEECRRGGWYYFKKDANNPDASLRSRNIIGIVSLTGLKWDGKEYTGGKFYEKFYDPRSGKTYNCKAWMKGDSSICAGISASHCWGEPSCGIRIQRIRNSRSAADRLHQQLTTALQQILNILKENRCV
jgi:hypothetical protein